MVVQFFPVPLGPRLPCGYACYAKPQPPNVSWIL